MIVTSSITAAQLVPQNKLRRSITFINIDATDTVYLKKERPGVTTVSATDFDLRLPPGASYSLNSMLDGKEAIQERYTFIASANTPQVSVFETEEIER